MQVQSVTGATLQVETIDLSGKQLTMGEGPYVGKLVEVVGVASGHCIAKLVIKFGGQFMAINPDDLVGYDGNSDLKNNEKNSLVQKIAN